MILKSSIDSLWKMKVVLCWLRFRYRMSYAQWLRLYVVSEEYVTNFIKYGKVHKRQSCWIRVKKYRSKLLATLLDDGQAFDPFVERKNSMGLHLITKLLPSKYIRKKNLNVFALAILIK